MQQERKGQRCSMRSTSAMKQAMKIDGSEKRRDQFLAVLLRHLKTCHIDTNEKLLVLGGSWQDAELLICAGFKDITLSNFHLELEKDAHSNPSVKVTRLAIDAEQIDLPDGSFDCVFAHEVLHHCRSPHRTLCEMPQWSGEKRPTVVRSKPANGCGPE